MLAIWILGTLTLGFLGYQLPFGSKPLKTGERSIVLLDNGNHIDIAVSREAFFRHAPAVFQTYRDYFPHHSYVAVGWGDENFMLNHGTIDTVTVKDLYAASFRSEHSAIRLSFLSSKVLSRPEKIEVSEEDEEILIKHIAKAEATLLKLDETDHEIYLRSPLAYSLLATCNDWTANALRSIRQPTPLFVSTSSSIIRYYEP